MSTMKVNNITNEAGTGGPTFSQGLTITGTLAATAFDGALAASNLTGALPAISGAALTNLPGGGKVLQVVSYLTATQASQTITTTDTVVNGISKAITPLGANSKFLVTVRWVGEVSTAWDAIFNIQMDGTRVNINSQGRGYGLGSPMQSYIADNNDSTPENFNISTLVSTSSVVGTAITFRLVADAHSSRTMWTNRCFNASTNGNYERGTSEIIITEIGA